ncbi:MAG TPA: ROK family protein [Acidiferrobacteraceae bacterium]|nr:ROK family protein [Acidiferrobacteraceae bacterium]
MVRLGVDLGGTKIEIVALDESGEELLRRRRATPADDYRKILDAIVSLVAAAESELRQTGSVGVGTPGALSRATGLLKNSNTVCLNGQPLLQDLERVLDRQVRVANDANCFALSEAVDGAGVDAEVVFGVIIGTGTGAGVVVNKKILTGPNAIAGEWGHNPLPWPQTDEWPGPQCYCGATGCIETFLSGPGLQRSHQYAGGDQLTAQEIVERAVAGDGDCQRSLDTYYDRMARALAHVINLLDPDVIVLGGGLSNIPSLYTEIPARWGQYVFSDRVDTVLSPPQHGDSGGVRGAAWLWASAGTFLR